MSRGSGRTTCTAQGDSRWGRKGLRASGGGRSQRHSPAYPTHGQQQDATLYVWGRIDLEVKRICRETAAKRL